jgi:hypothetical protein
MARTKISNTDLTWIFYERLKAFEGCPPGIPIAIVPTESHVSRWSATTSASLLAKHPQCAKRVGAIQKQLREIYVLKD